MTALGVKAATANKYLTELNEQMAEHQVDTELRIAHFLAQVMRESSRIRAVREKLNYGEQALLNVFPKYFARQQAKHYVRKPKLIGSRVYEGRMCKGVESTGDGYRYRGRGLIQLTGKSNYHRFSVWIGDDAVGQPDLAVIRFGT